MSGAKLDIARGDVSGILGAAKPIPWEVLLGVK